MEMNCVIIWKIVNEEGSWQVVKLVLERGLLRPGGILIFEHSKKMDFSDLDEFWQLRSYGSVQFSFFKKP